MLSPPSYDGLGLVNLIGEIETRLGGDSPATRLDTRLAGSIPDASTIVLVLFDGLGVAQLTHPSAGALKASHAGTLQAGFPTTTSASLATVATGMTPSQHGVIAHLAWMPEHAKVVNTLKWVDLTGTPVEHDFGSLLPRPNLWERLRQAGVEPITVQPGDFRTSPLTQVLYRGARFEEIWSLEEIVEATIQLAREPRRLIFTYVPQVDFAGHVFGLSSPEFSEALEIAGQIWSRLAARLPDDVALLGTADHGLIDFPQDRKHLLRGSEIDGIRFAGDTRGVHLWCDEERANRLAELTGGTVVDPGPLFGPQPSAEAASRSGRYLLVPPSDVALLPPGFDKRLRAYHGGLDQREIDIPLLVG